MLAEIMFRTVVVRCGIIAERYYGEHDHPLHLSGKPSVIKSNDTNIKSFSKTISTRIILICTFYEKNYFSHIVHCLMPVVERIFVNVKKKFVQNQYRRFHFAVLIAPGLFFLLHVYRSYFSRDIRLEEGCKVWQLLTTSPNLACCVGNEYSPPGYPPAANHYYRYKLLCPLTKILNIGRVRA